MLLITAVLAACGDGGAPALAPNPLALAATDSGDMARNEGTLVLAEQCSFLERGNERMLLVWPAPRTTWSAETGEIVFERMRGGSIRVRNGDSVVLAGGGSSREEDGLDGEAWAERIDWTVPPDPSCLVDTRWFVSDVEAP